MVECSRCGQEGGRGRFCAQCGQEAGGLGVATPAAGVQARGEDWRTDTAERPRSAVPPPVVAATPPEPARFPLYADEATATDLPATTAPPSPNPQPPGVPGHRRSGSATGWVPWVVGLLVMLVLAGGGLWLLLGGDSDSDRAGDRASDAPTTERPSRDDRTPEGRQTLAPAPVPEPGDLAALATVTAPAPAPATQDVTGSPVSFVAANLLDGVLDTCWRMPGDGTGETITFRFEEPTTVTEVGLVNGYAKTATDGSQTLDWYSGNRRTLAVEWSFDDGTVVDQELAQTRDLQSTSLGEGVETEQVTMRLVAVSKPGTGPASRDFTAISEVSLRGATR